MNIDNDNENQFNVNNLLTNLIDKNTKDKNT